MKTFLKILAVITGVFVFAHVFTKYGIMDEDDRDIERKLKNQYDNFMLDADTLRAARHKLIIDAIDRKTEEVKNLGADLPEEFFYE